MADPWFFITRDRVIKGERHGRNESHYPTYDPPEETKEDAAGCERTPQIPPSSAVINFALLR